VATLKITLVKSKVGRLQSHKATIEALGLHKIGSTVEHDDNPQIRGMVDKVKFLLKVEEV